MRRPEPWYWEKRGGWYVQIQRRQIPLGKAPKTKVPPKEILLEYHRIMATEGYLEEKERRRATVPEVAEVFLATRKDTRKNNQLGYAFFLRELCVRNMTRMFHSIRPADLLRIVESKPTWGPSTRHDFISKVLTMFRWAREAGYLEMNPMAGWRNPYPAGARTRVLTDEEFQAILDSAQDIEFRQILMFLRGTACRPGEAAIITAAHVHASRPLVILAPSEHKTGGRTGKNRVLIMPADVEVMVRALCRQHPTGPIFRNSRFRDQGWCHGSIARRFRRYRRKLGLPEDVVPYLIRHSTLSRILDGGTDLHLTAKIAGHVVTNTLMSTYYHPDVDKMTEAVDRAHAFKKKGRGV